MALSVEALGYDRTAKMHPWNLTKQQAYWDKSNLFSNMAESDPNQYVYIQPNNVEVAGLTSLHDNSSID